MIVRRVKYMNLSIFCFWPRRRQQLFFRLFKIVPGIFLPPSRWFQDFKFSIQKSSNKGRKHLQSKTKGFFAWNSLIICLWKTFVITKEQHNKDLWVCLDITTKTLQLYNLLDIQEVESSTSQRHSKQDQGQRANNLSSIKTYLWASTCVVIADMTKLSCKTYAMRKGSS